MVLVTISLCVMFSRTVKVAASLVSLSYASPIRLSQAQDISLD